MSDAPSFEQIYRTSFAFVWRSLRRLGVPDPDASDAAQEVFLIVYRRFADFEGRAKLSTWLFRICLNVARDRARSAKARREDLGHAQYEAYADPQGDADARAVRNEQLRLLELGLMALDLDERAVFTLFELEHLTSAEIAEMLDLPIGTVHSRLRRSRAQFQQALIRHVRSPQPVLREAKYMIVPRSLLDEDVSPEVREALEAGARMSPPADLQQTVWEALAHEIVSVSAGSSAVDVVAHGETGRTGGLSAEGSLRGILAKGSAVVLLGGAAVLVGINTHRAPSTTSDTGQVPRVLLASASEPSSSAIPTESPIDLSPSAGIATRSPLARAPKKVRRSAVTRSQAGSAATPAGAALDESGLILAARRALRSGDSRHALTLIATARQRFPDGALLQERDAIEIEALAQVGEFESASRRASEFLKKYPASPYIARVRKLVY